MEDPISCRRIQHFATQAAEASLSFKKTIWLPHSPDCKPLDVRDEVEQLNKNFVHYRG